ncbi:alkaline phosphatase D family protein [Hyphomonas sp.]|uniref:alkaline phosphatase D family protein n=1 Tax=Hyphomonas sp. TaxID=87 RepID=UPI000C54482C|nr:alkaline phosphatase D family protein [Hyphomonas sp.]MAB10570.1 alkaline phosphatase [Hyphomonas sp.]MAU66104.1 alkaline phosphatase [Hyphomonas sp.]MBM56417.1 alkaline phosphatase [Hyphomonas sp.]
MKRAALLVSLIGLAACQAPGPISIPGITRAPQSAEEALEAYYRALPDDYYPEAPPGLPLPPSDQAISRILVGSCLDEEQGDNETLRSVAATPADMFLMIGDNVYGDTDGLSYRTGDADLTELRESFADLAARPDFQAVRKAHPMMVAWDDHDYGLNDGGKHFAFRRLSERIHERFWGLANKDVGAWPGTYYARSFGPEGQRTQIIMLDTRFFRSDLTDTDDSSVKGQERYMPSSDPNQDMLGNDQWTWLENELQKPADLRLIVSSVQVISNAHGWEAWSRLPAERDRLYSLIRETGAQGVVFVSGDRHTGFLYRADDVLPYPAYELTASSFNKSYRDTTDEMDADQIGAGYAKENFGSLDINWTEGTVTLAIHASDGSTVEEATDKFR